MKSFELIAAYETILFTTDKMLKAAQSADWENLIILEEECRKLTKRIIKNNENEFIGDVLRKRKFEIIQQILAVDAEIRTFTQPWMGQLQNILSLPVYDHHSLTQSLKIRRQDLLKTIDCR